MRCLNCHYSLANLAGPPHRCPECGHEFDPNDSSTFETAAARRTHTRHWLLGVAAFALWAILVTPVTIDGIRNQRPLAAFGVIVFALIATCFGLLIYRSRPRS